MASRSHALLSKLVVLLFVSAMTTAALPIGAQAPPAIPGLVSWWTGSNTKDAAGHNDGFLINGATIGKGRIGRSFKFDGVNDYFMVPFDPSLDVGSQGSIAFWMRSEPTNLMNSCCQGLVTTDHFAVEISGGVDSRVGVNFFVFTTSGGFVHTSDANGGGAVVTPGRWHHIVGTYDGIKLQLYVDGLAWGSARFHDGSILPMAAGSFLAVGSEDGRTVCPFCIGTRYFRGEVDEVAIYNLAVTAEEVRELFMHGGRRYKSATD
jgi:hypothetical protein